jgi:hypothetical protein
MALPVFDAINKGRNDFANSVTVSLACSLSDTYLFAWGLIDRVGTAFTTAAYNGVDLGSPLITRDDQNQQQTALWGLLAPAAGAHNLVISATNANAKLCAMAAVYGGVNPATPIGTPVAGFGTSTGPTLAITLGTDDLAIVGGEQQNTGDPMVIQNGTERTMDTGGPVKFAWAERAGSGATQINWLSTNSHEWALVGVNLKGLASGVTGISGHAAYAVRLPRLKWKW